MKRFILIFCCFLAAMSAVKAQHEPIKHGDSARFIKHAAEVVRDAPFIFKSEFIADKMVRGDNNAVTVVGQLRVLEVIKGNIAVGDTVEFSYFSGYGIWFNNEFAGMESHGHRKDVVWENLGKPMYFFCKESIQKPFFQDSKKAFNLYSEHPFSVGGSSPGLWFSYLIFKTEYNFLNYINKIRTPKEIIIPKPETPSKKQKSKKKQGQKGGNETSAIEYLPAKTFNIHVSDSTDNLDAYNSVHNGWYSMSVYINGSVGESSFLKSYQFDVQYDDFYFYPNAATDATKIQISLIDGGILPTCEYAGVVYPLYTQTVTSLGANKFRVKLNYAPINNGSACNGANIRAEFSGSFLVHTIKFKAVNTAITCMPSVGKIVPNSVIALYDNVTSATAPPTTSTTNYLVQYGETRFRSAAPAVSPCVQIVDSLSFTPRTIRAGFDEVLTIKAYAKGLNNVATQIPWFGASKGNLGNIRFRDANTPSDTSNNPSYVQRIDDIDIVSWNAMEVKVKIPSKYINSFSAEGCAGSGKFIVMNSVGDTSLSKAKLHVEYAALNYSSSGVKKRILLANVDCHNQYQLRCHNSITSYSMQQCVWAAARAWNAKLGYDVFQIDTIPVTYRTHPTQCIVKMPTTNFVKTSTVMQTTQKALLTGNIVGATSQFYNSGFDIEVNRLWILGNLFQTDIPILNNDGSYTFANPLTVSPNALANIGTSFYEAIVHELGHSIGLEHCIDKDHIDVSPLLDKELMYRNTQEAVTSAVNRRTLTSGGGESLKGGIRIFTDSKTTIWNNLFTNTFTKPIYNLSLTTTNPLQTTLCGYGSKSTTKITAITNSVVAPTYLWQYKVNATDSIFSNIANKPNVFSANTNSITTTNTNPTLAGNLNIHKLKMRCTAILDGQGCVVTSDTFTFKASSANIILKPTPSRCLNSAGLWILPAPTPANGTFTAQNTNIANPPTLTGIYNTATSELLRNQFTTPSTYKIIYTSSDSLCSETTYMTTYDNCLTLGTTHKLYINEVYKDGTLYRNGGTNDPCNTMKVHFTALGNFVVGDTLKIKLSDISGKINKTNANIRQRIVGQYVFTSAATNQTDSIKIENMRVFVDTTSANYKVQIFLKKKGTNTIPEWGDKNIENLYFYTNKTCQSVGGGGTPCCTSGTRTAPINNFTNDEVYLYPNPTTNHFTLQTPEYDNATEIMIVNTQGQIVDKQQIFGTTNEIQTHEMPNGVYYVRIAQGQRSTTLKLVVNKIKKNGR